MSAEIALCIDSPTSADPSLAGLDGESLEAQPWLRVYNEGTDARDNVRSNPTLREAWVVSADDVEPINLAAALKADRPDLAVRLVDFEGGGSLLSRAHTAHIDEVMGKSSFTARYGAAKARASAPAPNLRTKSRASGGPSEDAPAAPLTLQTAAPGILATHTRSFVMPVVGGSGGCGKSTVSVLGALIAAELGFKTLLIDYDLQFGDAAQMLGIQSPLTLDAVLASPDRIREVAALAEPLTVIAAPTRMEVAEQIGRLVPQLLDELTASFEVVVANTGATWAEQHAALLERSTVALFLVDQRSSSVRACRHALELCARCGIATGQFQFVLNRCAKGAALSAADVSGALQGADVAEIRDGGRDVEDYLAAGAAADLLETGNELCTSLRRLLASVLPASGGATGTQAAGIQAKPLAKRRGRHESKRKGWGR